MRRRLLGHLRVGDIGTCYLIIPRNYIKVVFRSKDVFYSELLIHGA